MRLTVIEAYNHRTSSGSPANMTMSCSRSSLTATCGSTRSRALTAASAMERLVAAASTPERLTLLVTWMYGISQRESIYDSLGLAATWKVKFPLAPLGLVASFR